MLCQVARQALHKALTPASQNTNAVDEKGFRARRFYFFMLSYLINRTPTDPVHHVCSTRVMLRGFGVSYIL